MGTGTRRSSVRVGSSRPCDHSYRVVVTADLLASGRERLGIARLSDYRDSGHSWKEVVTRLAGAYVEWASTFDMPPEQEANTLRPILAPVTGMAPFDEANAAASSLLLAHSAAVSITNTMSYVGRLARLLILLEDLIDAGLVVIVPEPPVVSGFSFSGLLMELELSRSSLANDDLPDKEERVSTMLANAEMGIALDLCCMYPGRLDLACRIPDQVATLRRLIESADNTTTAKIAASHDRIRHLPDLLQQEFPVFDLATADLVKIRKDGLFDTWRSSLQRGLSIIAASDDSDLIDPRTTRRLELRDTMEEGASRIRGELGRSQVLRNGQIGVVSFGASCATGAVASLGGAEVGAAVGGASFLVTALLRWFGGRPSSGERAFRRLVFQLFRDMP